MRFVAIVGIVLLGCGAASAEEKGAAAGSGTALQVLAQSKLEVGDLEGHDLTQASGDGELKTPDKIAGVSFDGAKVKVLRQADLVKGSGVVRGYAVWEAKSGEKLFVMFGYTIPPYPAGKDVVPFEGTFEWIGGTGGLRNLRGKGTIEGEV
ncbi:MAG TPA: hypothetical protein VLF14_01800, partial [Candidatus Binatia bacterium]|nr:hypothetical protein [Candidatus Binatia bacterium]